jgi:hypothetical protein
MPKRYLPFPVALAMSLGCALLSIATIGVSSADAEIGIVSFDGAVNADSIGTPFTQAGGHPYSATTTFMFTQAGTGLPTESVKDIEVDLPPGFIGDPLATPRCTQEAFVAERCPRGSQIGMVTIFISGGFNPTLPVFNLVPPSNEPAQFGFVALTIPIHIDARVRPGSDYGVTVSLNDTSQGLPLVGSSLTFWGVPDDPSHEADRGGPTDAPPRPFLSNPTLCNGPLTTTMRASSWQHPDQFATASFVTHDNLLPPTPIGPTGCTGLPFDPSISLVPDTRQADAPSGTQAIELKIPQSENPAGLATAHLKEAVVSAPLGVTLNPGAADGLQACSDQQIALGSAAPGSCPNGSVVGTVKVVTPLLEAPLEGQVFVGAPECGPCSETDAQAGKLLRLFIQVQGSGVVIKAAGTATTDPVTGQLTVRFKELPQQPFSDLLLTLKGGQRAVFINPLTCGPATLNASLTPWSGTAPAGPSSAFTVDWDGAGGACPSTLPFSPSFAAGTVTPQAGGFSAFTTTISRPDRNQVLNAISVQMPPGLLGMLSSVPRCGEPQAAQGSCPAASKIATATVAAGTGGHPFWLSGPVYLTGGYKGAPFGLSVAVPAVAGPFNLGTVVVRAAVNVDPHTAQVTVTSDPLPQIIDGIKTHIQTVNVTVDREHFMFNPTNCSPLSVAGTITSVQGATTAVSSHFQAANCAALPFKPKLTALTQAKYSKAGGESLHVKVVSGSGQANIAKVRVLLPKLLPSRLTTLQKACPQATFNANPASCPAASVVGTATAVTPVLAHPLNGPAYLVSHGGAAFPDLVVVLRGEGITLYLDGNTDIKHGITSSTFNSVPDAPISTFDLVLPQGPHSALAANGNLCKTALSMPTTITGQNGAQVKQTTRIAVSGCPRAKPKAKAKKHPKARKG